MSWTSGVLGFDSRRGLGISLFTTAPRTVLQPTQPPIQWVTWALSLGVNKLGHEAGHSNQTTAEVKECVDLYLHSPNTPSWRGAQVKEEYRDNFTFTFTLWGVVQSVGPLDVCFLICWTAIVIHDYQKLNEKLNCKLKKKFLNLV
jgi:hypothetical protein